MIRIPISLTHIMCVNTKITVPKVMSRYSNTARSTSPPVRPQQAAVFFDTTNMHRSDPPDLKPKRHPSVRLLMLWIPVVYSRDEETDTRRRQIAGRIPNKRCG